MMGITGLTKHPGQIIESFSATCRQTEHEKGQIRQKYFLKSLTPTPVVTAVPSYSFH